MQPIAGKVAFVTGAASGIGFGVATALAQAGVKVMLCDIEKPALDAALAKLKATNADVDGVVADVSLKDELRKAADATMERFGAVNILMNNAGVGGFTTYTRGWRDADWDWVLAVNLRGVIWGVEVFAPLIEATGEPGHIVSTASIAGLLSGSSGAYNVSKYGVVALMEGLRPELAPRNIGVSVLCPGLIATNIMDGRRNLQARFAAGQPETPLDGPMSEAMRQFRARLAAGIDPLYVGELVREAIENDWPYIFTDNEFEPLIDARFAAIKAGFDRIRDRVPAKRG